MKPEAKKFLTAALVISAFTLPLFRSGGRTGLSFWEWVINHTVFGPPVEYVPEEDYMRELEGVEAKPIETRSIPDLMAFYQISKESATRLALRGR